MGIKDFLKKAPTITIFGDKTKIIRVDNFLGGKLTALFSELQVQLTDSKLTKDVTEIDSVTLFGSTKIFIPNNWEVIIKTTTIFGGFEDNRGTTLGEPDSDNKVLVIKGLVLFGGGEIKS